jgi:hypothetical protein
MVTREDKLELDSGQLESSPDFGTPCIIGDLVGAPGAARPSLATEPAARAWWETMIVPLHSIVPATTMSGNYLLIAKPSSRKTTSMPNLKQDKDSSRFLILMFRPNLGKLAKHQLMMWVSKSGPSSFLRDLSLLLY